MLGWFETGGRSFLTSILLASGVMVAAGCAASARNEMPAMTSACESGGRWIDPSTKQSLDPRTVFADLSKKDVVLLGEQHTVRDHHLWQAQTIAGLRALRPDLVLGFEMFPRSVQPVLDEWTSGKLGRSEFLSRSRWSEVWGYDPAFYMPMFDQARLNKNTMVALNVDRSLIAQVGREGWASVSEKDRMGITDPAPASASYRESLAKVFLAKMQHGGGKPAGETAGAADKAAPVTMESVLTSKPFDNFVQAQLTWDRAMAEALAAAKEQNPKALVVGVMGRGHIDFRHGVPHQLADLGVENVAVLVPVEAGEDCQTVPSDLADAVFVVDPATDTAVERPKPRLGVVIEAAEDGIRILRISRGSIAETAQLAEGDIVTSAAGVPVRRNGDLVEIIQRQAPGTWLPLDIKRGDDTLSVIAKFPPLPGAAR